MIRLIWSRGRSTLSAFENLIPALWRLRLQVQSISLSHAEEAEGMLLCGASVQREASAGKQEHKTGWRGKKDLQPDGEISSFAQGTRLGSSPARLHL